MRKKKILKRCEERDLDFRWVSPFLAFCFVLSVIKEKNVKDMLEYRRPVEFGP